MKDDRNVIHLQRDYKDDCTLGKITFPNGFSLYTLELPWKENKQLISCIPEGMYQIRMRHSGVVSRSTGGEYTTGWEVTDVDDRTYIMIHPGNTVKDFLGCIGVGLTVGKLGGKDAVLSSRVAFRKFMKEASSKDVWYLSITGEIDA